ncbi:flagellar biosynthetic protein FliQ [Candidatus Poribacteria bacterium]|jgi:flagellar biosynthetic protein FliQ|nr:flagellar biosynthetic protein FliQ [Candidatus Poribacteria bacterium]|tara:strand:+ start:178 stop:447 length:270 start_codon:yes stop_codon:yes gene_type:complete
MDPGFVMDIAIEALSVMVLVAAPVLGAALGTGLIVGILQAATSIQEMTLSFIPKLGMMLLALIIFGEWQLALLVDYFDAVFERIRTMNF